MTQRCTFLSGSFLSRISVEQVGGVALVSPLQPSCNISPPTSPSGLVSHNILRLTMAVLALSCPLFLPRTFLRAWATQMWLPGNFYPRFSTSALQLTSTTTLTPEGTSTPPCKAATLDFTSVRSCAPGTRGRATPSACVSENPLGELTLVESRAPARTLSNIVVLKDVSGK